MSQARYWRRSGGDKFPVLYVFFHAEGRVEPRGSNAVQRTAGNGATAPSRRVPVKDRTAPLLGRSMGARPATRRGQERRADEARDPPCLDNDEIAGWPRRGHRDANARRGAPFCPGRGALPHHRDMAPFIPLWNECRRHLGLAGRLQPSRHVESGAKRTARTGRCGV